MDCKDGVWLPTEQPQCIASTDVQEESDYSSLYAKEFSMYQLAPDHWVHRLSDQTLLFSGGDLIAICEAGLDEALAKSGSMDVAEEVETVRELFDAGLIERIIDDASAELESSCFGTPEMDTPLTLLCEVTGACPLNCTHCYQGGSSSERDLPHAFWDGVLDDAITLRVPIISFSGGDPLLYPHMGELLSKASGQFKKVKIATSAAYVPDELWSVLPKVQLDAIQVSVDGCAPTHNAIRGEGAYERTLTNVHRLASELPQTSLMVAFTANRFNLGDLPRVASEVRNSGASAIAFGHTILLGNACRDLLLDGEDWGAFDKICRRVKEEFDSDKFEVRVVEDAECAPLGDGFNCGAGWLNLAISCRGILKPCGPSQYQMCDKITSDGFAAAVSMLTDSNPFKNAQAPSPATCGDCTELRNCHKCIAAGLGQCDNPDCRWLASFLDTRAER